MAWLAIESFRKRIGKNKGLITGLVGVAMEGVATAFPVTTWPIKVLNEIAKHGIERLARPEAEVPELKAAGQPFPSEYLDQINSWLEVLTLSLSGISDRLDSLVELRGNESDAELMELVKQSLRTNEDLNQQFDACTEEIRYQTLSLGRVEEKLDELRQQGRKSNQSLEDIKRTLAQYAPLNGELEKLRQVQPEALEAILQSEQNCLANQREQAAAILLGHCQKRGIGTETICRQLGMIYFGDGNLVKARHYLEQAGGLDGKPSDALTHTLTSLSAASTHGQGLPPWRCLPRGFIVDNRYRVEGEVGRDGMASVYRAVGIINLVNRGDIVAVKVPAPDLTGSGLTGTEG